MSFKFPKLKNKPVLAPMAGITNAAFRLLCREQGAALCFTEMISANALARKNKAVLWLIDTVEEERPVGIQLFGQSTDAIIKSARLILENKDKFPCDIIDFNIGCPATKIMRQGSGAALLSRPKKVEEILSALVEECSKFNIPVTCKIRSGITKRKIVAADIAKIAEKVGCSAVIIHPRAQSQGYEGKADWGVIKQIKEAVGIPVIGNGDVRTGEDAKRMLETTKCDYVMIGRAAVGNPYVFRQISHYLETGQNLPMLSLNEQAGQLKHYFELLDKYMKTESMKTKGENDGRKDSSKKVLAMRLAAQHFTKGYKDSSNIRMRLNSAKTKEDIVKIINDYSKT